MTRYHALAIMLLLAGTASAQDLAISGTVIDARTTKPLAHVLVAVEGQPVFTETDDQGRFTLTVPHGSDRLVISLVGYALQRYRLAAGPTAAPLEIALAEGTGPFEQQLTVAGSAAPEAESTPAGATLHAREFQALRGVTLDDPMRALHALPAATSTDDFYSEFSIRGLGFQHAGMTVDGVPTRYLMHSVHGVSDGGSITMLNSDAIQSLSLLPGGYPQRQGRRIGAEIDIAMRDGDRSRFRARGGLSGTSATVVAEGPLASRGSWLVSARRSYLDLLLNRIEDGSSLAFGFTDSEAKVVFDLTAAHQLQALAIIGTSQFDEKPEELGLNDEAQVNGRTWLSAVTWRYSPSPRFSVSQRVFATGLFFHNVNKTGETLDRSHANDYGWRTDGMFAAGRHVIEFGGDAQGRTRDRTAYRSLNDAPVLSPVAAFTAHGAEASAYAQVSLHAGAALTVTPGIRIDKWNAPLEPTASPWLTASVAVTPSTRLRAGGGIYRQPADLEQQAGPNGGGSALRPERADHVDVSVEQSLPWTSTLTAGWFAREEQDVLWTPGAEPRRNDGVVQLGRGDARWVNDLSGRARGVEVIVRRDAPAGLSGWAAFAHLSHRYTSASTGESFRSDAEQRNAVSLFGYYPLSNRTTVGLKFRYGSNYPRTGYLAEQQPGPGVLPLFGGGPPLFVVLADRRNALSLPAYARLDARIDRTFMWQRRRLTLFAEVANVLNRTNLRNVPYDIDRNGRVSGGTASMLPILPSAGIVIEF
jgi:hypothetical protein